MRAVSVEGESEAGLNIIYCHIKGPSLLTPVWGKMAHQVSKCLERNVLLKIAFKNLNRDKTHSFTNICFTVPVDLGQTVSNGIFTVGDLDKLSQGLHFFHTLYTRVAKTSKDHNIALKIIRLSQKTDEHTLTLNILIGCITC